MRYLRCFSQIENVQINTKTIDLMQDAVNNIHQLYQKARIVNGSVRNDVDFLFDLDERQYELQRHIFCRTCYVSSIQKCCIKSRLQNSQF